MPQFLILADDFTDSDALNRRLAVRETHLTRMRAERPKGNFELGGAKLDAEGKMVGSMLVINAANEEDAWEWIKQDPYVTGTVWNKITVTPFRLANV